MGRHFTVEQHENWVKIKRISHLPFDYYSAYMNGQLCASFYMGDTFYLQVPLQTQPVQFVFRGYYLHQGIPTVLSEQFNLLSQAYQRERNFKPGDILVASDNVNEMMTGYMGHSALVVDAQHVIESPGGHPAIVKDTIQQFLDKHPEHAQFRPKETENGNAAVAYAQDYLNEYKQKLQEGKKEPIFSFNLTQSLKDPWEYIYCSKLVWLSYYHGAGYELENDYLWFSPEDLYSTLVNNDDFETIYEHENVSFQLNT